MSELRVAVVGVGYLGKFHAEKYSRMPDVTLVGVADVDPHAGAEVARGVGTEYFQDYRELLGRIDAASIVVPTPIHFEVSKAFLDRGVDLLIEKPMTTTLDEADQLIDLAAGRDLLIQVGHLERFNPAVVAARDVISDPGFIESRRLSTFKPRATDISVVLDLMIHDIDIVLNLVGSKLVAIHAAGLSVVSQHVDVANVRLEFENGCVANLVADRMADADDRKTRLFQKDGCITIDFANRSVSILRPGGTAGVETENLPVDGRDALDDEIKSFVRAVRGRDVPEVTGTMGREALRVALDVIEQIEGSRFNRT